MAPAPAKAPGRLLLPVPVALGALSVYLLLAAAMNHYVPESYMDEPFHVPQTQLYCQGHFGHWDPKISTFPGLYIVGTAYAWLAWLLAGWWTGTPLEVLCSGPYLRSVNGLLSVACLALFYALATELRGERQQRLRSVQQQEQEQQQQQQDSTRPPTSDNTQTNSNSSNTGNSNSRNSSSSNVSNEASPLLLAVVLALYPLHAFYSALYYTDIGALAALLACHLALLKGKAGLAATAGAAGVAFRQTNAVWVAFLLGARLLQDVQPSGSCSLHSAAGAGDSRAREGLRSRSNGSRSKQGGSKPEAVEQQRQQQQQQQQQQRQQQQQQQQRQQQQQQQQRQQHQQQPLHEEVLAVLQRLWLRRADLAARYWAIALVPLAFAAFVVLNGGVAVGDRSAHAPVLHPMQLHYMALFVAASGMLLLSAPQEAVALAVAVRRAPARAAAVAAAAAAACVLMVARGTFVHPYLVADNRHYTFYIWRRLFGVHWAARYALVPVYLASWVLWFRALGRSTPRLWRLGLLAACGATLVPAGLVEFRYFTVPFMLTVLHAPPPSRSAALCTAAAFLLVDLATLYVFMLRPFKWPDGSTARFMW